jgi:hypothetical protein
VSRVSAISSQITGTRARKAAGSLHGWHDRSPVQWPQWYAAAGWSERTEVLENAGASVAAWLVRPGEHPFHDPLALLTEHGVPGGLAEPAAAALRRGALVTVSPYGYRGGAAHRDGCPERDLEDLALQLVDHGRNLGACLVLSHYLYEEDDGAWLAALRAAGGAPVVLGADAVLDVRWASLADYYRWLGPGRRAQRAEARALDDPQLAWERHELPAPPSHRLSLVRLLASHAARFDGDDPPPDQLFESLVDGLELPRALLSVRRGDQPPRSVLAVLRGRKALHAKSFGTSIPRADYFPLVYPALLSYALDAGFSRIDYGGGSHQAKLLRGCRLRLGFGVLFVLEERLRPYLEPLAREVAGRKLDHFTTLARRFQHSALPTQDMQIPLACEGG